MASTLGINTNAKAPREVYSSVDPCGGSPRPCFIQGTRPGPAGGVSTTPPTSPRTGFARFVSRYTSPLPPP